MHGARSLGHFPYLSCPPCPCIRRHVPVSPHKLKQQATDNEPQSSPSLNGEAGTNAKSRVFQARGAPGPMQLNGLNPTHFNYRSTTPVCLESARYCLCAFVPPITCASTPVQVKITCHLLAHYNTFPFPDLHYLLCHYHHIPLLCFLPAMS